MKKLILLIAMLSIGVYTYAQEAEKPKFELHPGTLIQAWGGYYNIGNEANEQVGFGIRRLRFYARPTLTDKLSGFIQIEAAQSLGSLSVGDSLKTSETLSPFRLLHANIDYKINDEFTVTAGKFIGAGMKGAGLISSKNLDIIDRPETATTWAKETAGADFADYGVEVVNKQKFGLTSRLWVHNGSVNKNMLAGKSGANKSVAVDFYAGYVPSFAPSVEFGGSVGKGNQYVVDQFNYTAFLYVSPAPFRFKAEYASVKNNTLDKTFQGYYVFGAYAVMPSVEVMAMYDYVDKNTDVEKDEVTNITVGASYYLFPEKKTMSKITAGYVFKMEDESVKIDNDMFVIQYQLDLSL